MHRVQLLGICVFVLASLGTILPMEPTLGEASSADGAAPSAPSKREVIPAAEPVVEEVPFGLLPADWKSWATGQKITPMDRVTLTFTGGIANPARGNTGAGFWALGAYYTHEDPTYNTLMGQTIPLRAEIGFTLMPALNFFLGFTLYTFIDKGTDRAVYDDIGSEYRHRPNGSNITAVSFGWRIKFPIPLIGKGLFRMSRPECGTGFTPYLKFAFCYVHHPSFTTNGDISFPINTFTLHKPTNTLGLQFGGGLEYRWSAFGLFAEVNLVDLGAPDPAEGVDQPEAIGLICLLLGFAFYI